MRLAQLCVLLRVCFIQLFPCESQFERLEILSCLVLLVGKLVNCDAGEPFSKLSPSCTTDKVALNLVTGQAVEVAL